MKTKRYGAHSVLLKDSIVQKKAKLDPVLNPVSSSLSVPPQKSHQGYRLQFWNSAFLNTSVCVLHVPPALLYLRIVHCLLSSLNQKNLSL